MKISKILVFLENIYKKIIIFKLKLTLIYICQKDTIKINKINKNLKMIVFKKKLLLNLQTMSLFLQ